MKKRTFAAIARDIKANWKKVYFGAVPYLDAMLTLETDNPEAMYILDSAKEIVLYFLANASTFRGEKAKELKAELRELIK